LRGDFFVNTMSDIANLPPVFKTLKASSKTLCLSKDRFITQFEMMTSPFSPTSFEAKKQSSPAPLPNSKDMFF